jgi:hypothetical protein
MGRRKSDKLFKKNKQIRKDLERMRENAQSASTTGM